MKITGKENKQWSRLGSRATYGQAILMLAEKSENLTEFILEPFIVRDEVLDEPKII